jgi:hypothetical protein
MGVLVALSIDSTVRLTPTPPSDFVSTRVLPGEAKPELASNYWEVAVRLIQWKYNHTSVLPEQPPSDFELIEAGGKRSNSENATARLAYWSKLREEWPRPENWHTTYGLDLEWATRSAQTLSRHVMNFINHT